MPCSVNGAMAASTGISSISAAESAPAIVVPFKAAAFDLQRADHLAMKFFELRNGDAQAHLHEDIEKTRASGIHEKMRDSEL